MSEGAAAIYRIAELTAPEVAGRIGAGAVILLPFGSLETHGPQSPMGDFLLAESISDSIAEAAGGLGADVLVLPAIPFGGEDFFAGVPGGISLSTPVLQAIIEQAVAALARNGVRHVVFVNGHAGSIPAIEAASRSIRRSRGLVIPTLHLWRVAGALHEELGGNPDSLGHGGDPVWSVARYLAPELCHPDRARPRIGEPTFLGLAVTGFGTVRCAGVEFAAPIEVEEIAPGGVACADSREGSAELGGRIVTRLVEAGAAMVLQLKKHMP
jgi:creatinine amidohydrolase